MQNGYRNVSSPNYRTLAARSAQHEVVVGTDWQWNGSLQRSLVKEAEDAKRANK
jgi:hypothetical protein